MRVLFLRRQRVGGIATYTELLRHGLEKEGVDVVIDDADEWIPNETGFSVDKKVSKLVQEAAKGFDLIHAFGYRAAWACSEAFYLKRPWVYTAYDMPKTTASQLIDRLNPARVGLVPSKAVKDALEDGDAVNVEIVRPCVWIPDDLPTVEEARRGLGLDVDSPVILGMGPFGADRGFKVLADTAEQMKHEAPNVSVAFVGENLGFSVPAGVTHVERDYDRWRWMMAAEIVVVPYTRAGFSMVAAEAMAMGKPVVLRDAGGLSEMGVQNVSIELFENDDELLFVLLELLNSPIHRESLGDAARIRANERFGIERCSKEHFGFYRDLLSR